MHILFIKFIVYYKYYINIQYIIFEKIPDLNTGYTTMDPELKKLGDLAPGLAESPYRKKLSAAMDKDVHYAKLSSKKKK